MGVLGKIFSPVGDLLDRVICVAFAVGFAQLPIYIHQYLNVLSGALTEARLTYDDIVKRAGEMGLSVQEFIDKHLNSGDEVFKSSGEIHQATVERYEGYLQAFKALSEATIIEKPFTFFAHLDPVLQDAVQFEPGVPLNLEGAVYAGLGIITALLVIGLFKGIFGLGSRKKAAKVKA